MREPLTPRLATPHAGAGASVLHASIRADAAASTLSAPAPLPAPLASSSAATSSASTSSAAAAAAPAKPGDTLALEGEGCVPHALKRICTGGGAI